MDGQRRWAGFRSASSPGPPTTAAPPLLPTVLRPGLPSAPSPLLPGLSRPQPSLRDLASPFQATPVPSPPAAPRRPPRLLRQAAPSSPSGRCPGRSRRIPHSWWGRARTEAQRKERGRDSRGRGCTATLRRQGSAQAGFGAEERGKPGKGHGAGEREVRHLRQEGKSRAGSGGRGGQTQGSAAGAGPRRGDRRAIDHTLPALSLAASPSRPSLLPFPPLARRGRIAL